MISFAPGLLGKQVAWFTDNTNIVSIVHSGSKVTELQDLALGIFHVCVSFLISLEMKWIPRDLNSFADHLSRIIDFDDYTINDDVFPNFGCSMGSAYIDEFASSYNAKLSRFNSTFYKPRTEAVDAFLQDWEFENNCLLNSSGFPNCESCRLFETVMRRVRLSFLCGSLHIFGYCCVMMEDTVIPLFTIRLCCPNLSNTL